MRSSIAAKVQRHGSCVHLPISRGIQQGDGRPGTMHTRASIRQASGNGRRGGKVRTTKAPRGKRMDEDGESVALERLQRSGDTLDCPHFSECSGCSIAEKLDTPPIRKVADEFFESRGHNNFNVTLASPAGWRCRARLAVRPAKGGLRVGLFKRGTHDVVEIPECSVHHPRINEASKLIELVARKLKVAGYNELSGAGDLRYLQLTVAGRDGEAGPRAEHDPLASVQVALVWNCTQEEFEAGKGRSPQFLRRLAAELWHTGVAAAPEGQPLLHSVWANFQTARGNAILGREWALLHGERYMWQQFGGADICFSPGSFAQVNFRAMELCLREIQRWVPDGAEVAEFHAGVGCIGLSLAASNKCSCVRGIELNPTVLEPYLVARQRLLQAKQAAGDQAPVLELRVMSAGTDPITQLQGADVVVMDPPRKGIEPELMEALMAVHAHGVQTVIYLSCGFKSMMRDYDALVASGVWEAVHAEGFIFFPGADHIETLAVFRRT